MAAGTKVDRKSNRKRTTIELDRDLVKQAQAELKTGTITETVETALRIAAGNKPRGALGASGLPSVAHRVKEALGEAGFGQR